MHSDPSIRQSRTGSGTAVDRVLREARKLHRAAASESLACALPVLRRLIASDTLQGISLPQLRKQRKLVRRKHILRMLAIEAGHASWEAYRHVLAAMQPHEIEDFDMLRRELGYPNLWFASLPEARAFAAEHGGRVLPFRRQAVVIPETEVAT